MPNLIETGSAVMFNLFDILERQTGNSMQALGQQFGLSPEQSRRAMEALLPALTLGLQRNVASDPTGFGRLFGLLGADPTTGGTPKQPAQPDLLLGQLFGSPQISQAVLQQAAAFSGIATPALRQMLPTMAGMVVAGIVHLMINQPPPAAVPAPPTRHPPNPEPMGAFPAARFWNNWIEGFLNTTKSDAPAPVTAATLEDVTPAGRKLAVPASEPKQSSGDTKAPSEDISMEAFQKLFQTGIEVQEQNVKAMHDIFDSFWSSAGKASPKDAVTATSTGANSLPGEPRSAPARKAKPPATRSGAARKPTSKPGSNGKAG